jgi:hypothetical protein
VAEGRGQGAGVAKFLKPSQSNGHSLTHSLSQAFIGSRCLRPGGTNNPPYSLAPGPSRQFGLRGVICASGLTLGTYGTTDKG